MFFIGQPQKWQPLRKLACVIGLAVCLVASGTAHAKKPMAEPAVTGSVAVTGLPAEGQATYRAVLSGGPFPYRKDGSVFGNRERALPAHARGYYHEYTVKTPGAADRGARRIICGGAQRTRPEACFYTGDHYASFLQITP